MHRVALFVVVASVVLSGCNRRAEDVKDCIAGKTQPAMDVGQAMSVLKAAGFEISRPDNTPVTAAPAPTIASSPAPPTAAQGPAQRQFSLLCNTTVQGQRVSQSLSVDLDSDTVNGA